MTTTGYGIWVLLVTILLALKQWSDSKNTHKKKVRYRDVWDFLDNVGENKIISSLMLGEKNKYRKKMNDFVLKHGKGTPITVERMQILSILSVVTLFLVQMIMWGVQSFNVIWFQENLKQIAELIGSEEIAKIMPPDLPKMVAISLSAYIVPYGMLMMYATILRQKAENEALILQSYVIMMLRTTRSVKYILNIMFDRANIYKEPLRRCLEHYSQDPKESLEKLKKDAVGDIRFESSVGALEKALFYDRGMASVYLSNSRRMQTNLKKIEKQKKDKTKQIAGAVLMVLPLITLVAVAAYPWVLTTLKVLTSMNAVQGG